MTHAGPMADSEGDFSAWKDIEDKCQECGIGEMEVREWDSSCGGYTDYQYRCKSCGHRFWVDGPDS